MAARRRTSFSCSRSRLRFFSSRISASSARVRPSRTPSSISARFTHRCRQDSEIPKSLAIWDIGASLRRATATTSRRNSRGNAFGIDCLLPVRVILTCQESTKGWADPGVFRAFQAAQGPITGSYYCNHLVAAAVKTSKPTPSLFWLFKRADKPTLHIMNNLMESHVEDLEIMELTRLVYGCQDLGRRVNELLVGGQRAIVVDAAFDVVSDVLAILDERKAARTAASEPHPNEGVAGNEGGAQAEPHGPATTPAWSRERADSSVPANEASGPSLQQPSALELQRDAFRRLQGMFDRIARRQGQL